MHSLHTSFAIARQRLTVCSAWIKESATKSFDEHQKDLNKKPHEAHREIFKLGLKELATWRKNPVYFTAASTHTGVCKNGVIRVKRNEFNGRIVAK